MKMVHETKRLGTTAIKYITYLRDVCHSYQRIMLSYSYSYSSGGARLAVCGGQFDVKEMAGSLHHVCTNRIHL